MKIHSLRSFVNFLCWKELDSVSDVKMLLCNAHIKMDRIINVFTKWLNLNLMSLFNGVNCYLNLFCQIESVHFQWGPNENLMICMTNYEGELRASWRCWVWLANSSCQFQWRGGASFILKHCFMRRNKHFLLNFPAPQVSMLSCTHKCIFVRINLKLSL